MDKGPFSKAAAQNALDRLIDVARPDTGHSRRVANLLLAWWHGADWGHFALAELFGYDAPIETDIPTLVGILGQHARADYPNAFASQDETLAEVDRSRQCVQTE